MLKLHRLIKTVYNIQFYYNIIFASHTTAQPVDGVDIRRRIRKKKGCTRIERFDNISRKHYNMDGVHMYIYIYLCSYIPDLFFVRQFFFFLYIYDLPRITLVYLL